MTTQKDNSNKHGYWIHTKVEDSRSVTGFFILPECKCSKCGFWFPMSVIAVRTAWLLWMENISDDLSV